MGEYALVKTKIAGVVVIKEDAPATHKECGSRLKKLDDGRAMCEHCMKVGWPIEAK